MSDNHLTTFGQRIKPAPRRSAERSAAGMAAARARRPSPRPVFAGLGDTGKVHGPRAYPAPFYTGPAR